MADENWRQIKEIFNAALRQKAEDRRKFLDCACNGDESLREEVKSLLDSYNDAESFMESPAAGEVAKEIAGDKNFEKGNSFGHYEIVRQIGVGGMGEVYLARDTRLNRKVALKLLSAHIIEDKTRVSRFRQEAFATSALNHPNIVTIYEIGESSGRNFIATEFIEGITLREFLQKKLSIGEILDIVLQIASALSAAHGAGIVHRDIKPENIMIRPDGLIKVLDFGIAKYRPTEKGQKALIETEIGEIIGTAAYMSPEQARGLKVNRRTDIWSLGAILYEMIARKLPFEGKTKSDRIAAILEREPESLTKFRHDTPPELEQVVRRALAKDETKRYSEITEMAEDLHRLREKSGDQSSKHPLIFNTRKSAPRHFYPLLATVLLVIAAIGFGYYFWSAGKKSSNAEKKTLAVLPFVNSGGNPNAEYLSDGITESIINNLSQISHLKVMSKNSAFRFKNEQTDTRLIASQLGVETLVTGDIKQIENKFVINIRLINAADDSQIWGNQYVKTTDNIFAVQNEIAQAVADNLRVILTDAERRQLNKKPTDNFEAYQLYLQGRANTISPNTSKAINYFQRAIEIDPNYAPAYAGLASAYRTLVLADDAPPGETMPKAKAAAMRAIALDDQSSEAHAALGTVAFFYEWNWNEAERYFRRALELNPNSADAHFYYAHLLSNLGRHEESLAELKHAIELDPLYLGFSTLEGQFLFFAGKYDEAANRLKKVSNLEPNFWLPHLFLARVYIEKGMFREAVEEAVKAREMSGGNTEAISYIGYALAKSGEKEKARQVLEELRKLSAEKYVPPLNIALVYNALGETDQAFDLLEEGYKVKDVRMVFLKVDPKWNNLRTDPRFIEMMRRMNF